MKGKRWMNRRTFLAGVGTLGTLGTVATTGVVPHESVSVASRAAADTSALTASSRVAREVSAVGAPRSGITLGYLPGSANLFGGALAYRSKLDGAIPLRWSDWKEAHLNRGSPSFKATRLVDISIGVLHRSNPAASAVKGLAVVAHFAIDDAPYFAAFDAWRHETIGSGATTRSTQLITFTAVVPNCLTLEVNYTLDASRVANVIAPAGTLSFSVGDDRTPGAGLATGLYVLAAPSASTGVEPDFRDYVFSGDPRAPIADQASRAPDFDYVTVAIRSVAV